VTALTRYYDGDPAGDGLPAVERSVAGEASSSWHGRVTSEALLTVRPSLCCCVRIDQSVALARSFGSGQKTSAARA
jgi:hypothetical protein